MLLKLLNVYYPTTGFYSKCSLPILKRLLVVLVRIINSNPLLVPKRKLSEAGFEGHLAADGAERPTSLRYLALRVETDEIEPGAGDLLRIPTQGIGDRAVLRVNAAGFIRFEVFRQVVFETTAEFLPRRRTVKPLADQLAILNDHTAAMMAEAGRFEGNLRRALHPLPSLCKVRARENSHGINL